MATLYQLPQPSTEPTREEAVADAAEILLAIGMTVEDIRSLVVTEPLSTQLVGAVEEIKLRLTATGVGAILDLAP